LITKYITDAFACSAAAGKWLFKEFDYEIIPNAIETTRYFYMESIRKDVRTELGIDEAAYVIGMVANFSAIKNHKYLVDIFSEILKEIPNTYLMLVGDGKTRGAVEKQVHRLGFSSRVFFLGQRKDVPRLLQAIDVFVLPSITEGFSISALEAETVGVPCVLSTGIPKDVKLFAEMDTFFLPLQDKNAWIAKIVSLKDTKKKNWVQEVSKTQYDVKANSERLLEFYEKKYKMVSDGVYL
ncbi:MAG: glycosyltransferase, partial [Anaerotignum sp.]|nr:glycosyltransferase [Anaerotignum sp.]